MKRTISVMLGKGSINHNSRKFMASNIDSERSQSNISYCNKPIKEVYKELFNDAVKRYNEKQTRSDRRIDNYYEKIRTGKQEKLFYEVILQIGNNENMSAITEEGQLASRVLDEYMKDFQKRNPYLHVFSAHLHMDEATPHLHIDFVPFITESKRGLDTRVSLKQALASQGFSGGSRGDTEWNQWVKSEKEQLSQVMECHGIGWEQLGTHHEHLSVIDYKKEQRTKEVAALDEKISDKQDEVDFLVEKNVSAKNELTNVESKIETTKNKYERIMESARSIATDAKQYDSKPEFTLPTPKPLMSSKTYHETVAAPLVRRLKDVIRNLLLQLSEKTRDFSARLNRANNQIWSLSDRINKLEPENNRLRGVERDYNRVRVVLGGERVDKLVASVKEQESIVFDVSDKKRPIKRDYAR